MLIISNLSWAEKILIMWSVRYHWSTIGWFHLATFKCKFIIDQRFTRLFVFVYFGFSFCFFPGEETFFRSKVDSYPLKYQVSTCKNERQLDWGEQNVTCVQKKYFQLAQDVCSFNELLLIWIQWEHWITDELLSKWISCRYQKEVSSYWYPWPVNF